MAKVSVIIPVYGVEKYIERCVRSLFEQTLDDMEFLFVDDCTPDRSIEILKTVLEEYPKRKAQVIIHRMDKNVGQAIARKWGIQNATGEYLIHCDSDDWVDVEMYRTMYEKGKEEDADVVVCDYKITDGSHTCIKKGVHKVQSCLSDMMYSKISWSLCNKLIKKVLYSDNIQYPSNNVGEDMAIVLQIMRRANIISYIPQSFYSYFCNPTSTMNRKDRKNQLDKYNQMFANIEIVEKDYIDRQMAFNVEPRLNAIKFYCQILLIPVLDNDIKKLWKKRFNFSIISVIMNPEVKVRYKLIYCSYVLKCYNLIKKIRKCLAILF